MNGVDISYAQGEVDLGALKQSCKVDFVYAKATEGLHTDDDQFVRNHDMCKVHGVPFGAYHFLHFGESGNAQAEHFLATTDGRLGTLLPMVDVEGGGQDGVTDLATLVGVLSDFVHTVEAKIGKRMVIYADYGDWQGFMHGTDAFSGHPFWIAAYNNDRAPPIPRGVKDVVLWQWTSGGVVPGISSFVDLDRLLVDIGEISL